RRRLRFASLVGSSVSSVAIGTGAKSFTTQTAKNFPVGETLVIASNANPSNFMRGQVTTYNAGTGALTVNVTTIGGAGTFANWLISVASVTFGSVPNKLRRVTTASGTADGTDTMVTIERAGPVATTINLPPVGSRANVPLVIADYSSGIVDPAGHTITLVP